MKKNRQQRGVPLGAILAGGLHGNLTFNQAIRDAPDKTLHAAGERANRLLAATREPQTSAESQHYIDTGEKPPADSKPYRTPTEAPDDPHDPSCCSGPCAYCEEQEQLKAAQPPVLSNASHRLYIRCGDRFVQVQAIAQLEAKANALMTQHPNLGVLDQYADLNGLKLVFLADVTDKGVKAIEIPITAVVHMTDLEDAGSYCGSKGGTVTTVPVRVTCPACLALYETERQSF